MKVKVKSVRNWGRRDNVRVAVIELEVKKKFHCGIVRLG